VDGARADDDEQPAEGIAALDNGDGLIARLDDRLPRLGRLRDLALQQVGRREGVVAANAPVLRVVRVADGGVLDVELGRGLSGHNEGGACAHRHLQTWLQQ
jgi:hypothetical protein